MSRRYLQGTLDYACGIYAVINALALLYKLDLNAARTIYKSTMRCIAENPLAWPAFLANYTDHYWLIQYMLERWCCTAPYAVMMEQPFSDCLLPREECIANKKITQPFELYRDTEDDFESHGLLSHSPANAAEVWSVLAERLTKQLLYKKTVALVRFHRFLPKHSLPYVSHWTVLKRFQDDILFMHDASGEDNSIFQVHISDILPPVGEDPFTVLVPASVLFMTKP